MGAKDKTAAPSAIAATPAPSSGLHRARVLWRFSRPHTIIGTSLSVIGLFVLAQGETMLRSPGAIGLDFLLTWLACLGGNLYIVGLNQLTDVAIDRINKPRLPLAAGHLSPRQGQIIVGGAGLLAIAIAATQGPALLATVGFSVLIGTAYSLPPLRLKRFPFWASFCILAVRGGVVNLGLFYHYQRYVGGAVTPLPGRIWALTAFILVFSIAIAIFKDIPDLEGDRHYQIQTLTVRWGQPAVFQWARWLLTLAYSGMIGAAIVLTDVQPLLWGGGHAIALGLCWFYSRRVAFHPAVTPAPSHRWSYPQFYQFIWRLFFAEYILVPLAYLLR